MATGIFTLMGVLCFTSVAPKLHTSSRHTSYLSCTSYNVGDYVMLDCFYNGGLPFPSLTWTGPGGLYEEKTSTRRFAVNVSREHFVNRWDTIYKCKANYRYTSSTCYIGRGIGSYVGIAFGVLGLVLVLCIVVICICKACHNLSEKIERWRARSTTQDANMYVGYNNPTYKKEAGQQEKAPEKMETIS